MEKNGLLVVNKPVGITSHTAVAKIRRLFGVEKAGHTGTLDPMASGVLPILVGRAVKAAEFLTDSDKRYRAVLSLGVTTDTEDATGTVLSRSDAIPDEAALNRLAVRAGAVLDRLTLGRAARYRDTGGKLALACCAVTEKFYELEESG